MKSGNSLYIVGSEPVNHQALQVISKVLMGAILVFALAGAITAMASEPRERQEERAVPCRRHLARATGYYPRNDAMEGGYRDRRGKRLHSLQEFLDGRAAFVSVAMDPAAFAYGTPLTIPELDEAYERHIVFKVVDTGGAFFHQGTGRIDICTASERDALEGVVNRHVTLDTCD